MNGQTTQKWRSISLDSGGLYGYFSALMLKQLCKTEPNFLRNPQNENLLFAGTSAGALSALILAKYKNPRDGIPELLKFWNEPMLFWNSNPIGFWTSMMGLSPWFDTNDYLSVISRYFKGWTLGDLNQKVLITSYNWFGDPNIPPERRSWKTKVYYNFGKGEADKDISVFDVASHCFMWYFFRQIYQGRQDGELIGANPAMFALSKIMQCLREEDNLPSHAIPQLSNISILSVGVGEQPHYIPFKNADWGGLQWYMGFFHPETCEWVMPINAIAFHVVGRDLVDRQASWILNYKDKHTPNAPNYYHRLNPRVFRLGIFQTMLGLRNNPIFHRLLINQIQCALKRPDTRKALEVTRQWLHNTDGWLER